MWVLLTPLAILLYLMSSEVTEKPQWHPPLQDGPGSGHSWEISEFPRHCRAQWEHFPTSIHLTFPPHPRELFVGLLSRLGGGGDQVVIDIPLNPTPLGGIFSFFLKTEKRGKRNTLNSASFTTEQTGECYLLGKDHQGSLYCSTSSCRTFNKCLASWDFTGVSTKSKYGEWKLYVELLLVEKMSLQPICKYFSAAEPGKCRDKATKITWNLFSLPVKYTGHEVPNNIQCDNPHQTVQGKTELWKIQGFSLPGSKWLQQSWEWDRTKQFCTFSLHGSMCRHMFRTGFLPFSPKIPTTTQ